MDRTCLLVNLSGGDVANSWQVQTAAHQYNMVVRYADSVEEAEIVLNSGAVLVMIVFINEFNDALNSVLKSFQSNVGCIAEFQGIVCDDPAPKYLASVFEFGIENFMSYENWPEVSASIARYAGAQMDDKESATAKTVNLTITIKGGDREKIKSAREALGDLGEHDFRAAFAAGKAAEVTGDYTEAIKSFSSASGMNRLFKPSASSQGEALLVSGRVDEALEILESMEKQNPFDVSRKATLASAYIEKGDIQSAAKYVREAGGVSPTSSKTLEARAQVLLCTGQITEAFKLMDQMSEVGPFFAAKLNELGIKLSKAGKSKSALALYQKAHKIVRPELRYKISMNAALACRRLDAWDMSLKYLARCEKEYGERYEKLAKIRKAIRAQRKKYMQDKTAKAGGKKKVLKKKKVLRKKKKLTNQVGKKAS